MNSKVDGSKLKIWLYLVKFLSCGTSCVEIETDLTIEPRIGDPTTFQEIGEYEGIPIVIGPLAFKTLEEFNITKLTFDVGLYWWSKPLCLLENPRKYAPRIEGYCSYDADGNQLED